MTTRSKSKHRKLKLAAVLSFIAFLVIFGISQRQKIASYLVAWTSYEAIAPEIYIDPAATADDRVKLLKLIVAAKQRVASFYGNYTATPRIIVGSTMVSVRQFSNNEYASSYYLPFKTVIVLGPKGQNVDVIAHELGHAELSHRVGWWNINFRIPTWFDEGLAMQLDHREEYSEAKYQDYRRKQTVFPEFSAISSGSQFFSGSLEASKMHYVLSKHEVARWLGLVQHRGFYTLLEKIRAGGSFEHSYHTLENSRSHY